MEEREFSASALDDGKQKMLNEGARAMLIGVERLVDCLDGRKKFTFPDFERSLSDEREDWERFWSVWSEQPFADDEDGTFFFGTIVVRRASATGSVAALEVLDGGRRLTTFSLLVCALRYVAPTLGGEVADSLFNVSKIGTNDYLKLTLAGRDGVAFQKIALGISLDEQDRETTTARCYSFFCNRLKEALSVPEFDVERFWSTVRDAAQVVWIRIDDGDEAFDAERRVETKRLDKIPETIALRGLALRRSKTSDFTSNAMGRDGEEARRRAALAQAETAWERFTAIVDNWREDGRSPTLKAPEQRTLNESDVGDDAEIDALELDDFAFDVDDGAFFDLSVFGENDERNERRRELSAFEKRKVAVAGPSEYGGGKTKSDGGYIPSADWVVKTFEDSWRGWRPAEVYWNGGCETTRHWLDVYVLTLSWIFQERGEENFWLDVQKAGLTSRLAAQPSEEWFAAIEFVDGAFAEKQSKPSPEWLRAVLNRLILASRFSANDWRFICVKSKTPSFKKRTR